MQDLFSLNGKNRDYVIMHFKKEMYQWEEKDGWITVITKKWCRTMVVSYMICNDMVTLVIVKTKITPFYERYTVL
ncbi:hypothetical protein [Chryseobacterium gleum]|uniref:hypothetical protein n=1 Tax=Chryseobacterium gleum TaxID=250 RepID=UPI001E448D9D|nr:hypothetical protein [Chryseobacterium gleum]MCD9615912.1 hypothetical protein [Chryseobacterium gleum]MCE4064444.1 hypothetical protein [Chryseobacterium gleum]